VVESYQMAWINKIDNPQSCIVHTIKKSAKGLILITNDYDVFLYADSQIAKHILEALEYCSIGIRSSLTSLMNKHYCGSNVIIEREELVDKDIIESMRGDD